MGSCGLREPGCLARGASHCLHCSDQGRGSCHSQAVLLLGRKGQDGDLGAAPAAPECSLPFGSAGGQPGPQARFQAFGCSQGLGLLPLEREVGLSENLHQMTGQKCSAYLLDEH